MWNEFEMLDVDPVIKIYIIPVRMVTQLARKIPPEIQICPDDIIRGSQKGLAGEGWR